MAGRKGAPLLAPGKNRNSMLLGTCVPIFAVLEEVEPKIPKVPDYYAVTTFHCTYIHCTGAMCYRKWSDSNMLS